MERPLEPLRRRNFKPGPGERSPVQHDSTTAIIATTTRSTCKGGRISVIGDDSTTAIIAETTSGQKQSVGHFDGLTTVRGTPVKLMKLKLGNAGYIIHSAGTNEIAYSRTKSTSSTFILERVGGDYITIRSSVNTSLVWTWVKNERTPLGSVLLRQDEGGLSTRFSLSGNPKSFTLQPAGEDDTYIGTSDERWTLGSIRGGKHDEEGLIKDCTLEAATTSTHGQDVQTVQDAVIPTGVVHCTAYCVKRQIVGLQVNNVLVGSDGDGNNDVTTEDPVEMATFQVWKDKKERITCLQVISRDGHTLSVGNAEEMNDREPSGVVSLTEGLSFRVIANKKRNKLTSVELSLLKCLEGEPTYTPALSRVPMPSQPTVRFPSGKQPVTIFCDDRTVYGLQIGDVLLGSNEKGLARAHVGHATRYETWSAKNRVIGLLFHFEHGGTLGGGCMSATSGWLPACVSDEEVTHCNGNIMNNQRLIGIAGKKGIKAIAPQNFKPGYDHARIRVQEVFNGTPETELPLSKEECSSEEEWNALLDLDAVLLDTMTIERERIDRITSYYIPALENADRALRLLVARVDPAMLTLEYLESAIGAIVKKGTDLSVSEWNLRAHEHENLGITILTREQTTLSSTIQDIATQVKSRKATETTRDLVEELQAAAIRFEEINLELAALESAKSSALHAVLSGILTRKTQLLILLVQRSLHLYILTYEGVAQGSIQREKKTGEKILKITSKVRGSTLPRASSCVVTSLSQMLYGFLQKESSTWLSEKKTRCYAARVSRFLPDPEKFLATSDDKRRKEFCLQTSLMVGHQLEFHAHLIRADSISTLAEICCDVMMKGAVWADDVPDNDKKRAEYLGQLVVSTHIPATKQSSFFPLFLYPFDRQQEAQPSPEDEAADNTLKNGGESINGDNSNDDTDKVVELTKKDIDKEDCQDELQRLIAAIPNELLPDENTNMDIASHTKKDGTKQGPRNKIAPIVETDIDTEVYNCGWINDDLAPADGSAPTTNIDAVEEMAIEEIALLHHKFQLSKPKSNCTSYRSSDKSGKLPQGKVDIADGHRFISGAAFARNRRAVLVSEKRKDLDHLVMGLVRRLIDRPYEGQNLMVAFKKQLGIYL